MEVELKDYNFVTSNFVDIFSSKYLVGSYDDTKRFHFPQDISIDGALKRGEIIYNTEVNKPIVCYTYNDYIIDNFRLLYSKDNKGKTAQLIQINRNGKPNCIEIMSNGQYSENQPKGFRKPQIDFLSKAMRI